MQDNIAVVLAGRIKILCPMLENGKAKSVTAVILHYCKKFSEDTFSTYYISLFPFKIN